MQSSFEPLDIVVVGGMGVGLSFTVNASPLPGETVMAEAVTTVNGGKASNQAIGVAALGASSAIVSAVGADPFGAVALGALTRHGVATDHVLEIADTSTMVGALLVEPTGENRIVVAPGALAALTPAHIDAAEALIRDADICIVSLEIPADAARQALTLARRHGVTTVLNPAPAPSREDAALLLPLADVVTPNRSEAEHMAGGVDAHQAARRLREIGADRVVMTLGEQGALVVDDDGAHAVRAPAVTAVDTSGAGDAFTAALCVAMGSGLALRQAVAFACDAASLVVQATGFVEALEQWRDVKVTGAASR